MAAVHLDFVPPDRPGFTKLYIYEAPDAVTGMVRIETVTNIGTFPNYITGYTTTMATSVTDWFAIQWEDAQGAQTEVSSRIQGGTDTVVGEVIQRVMQRDRSLDENIVKQETEAAVEMVFGKDPYSVTSADFGTGRQYRMVNGLVYLVLARVIMANLVTAARVQSATLGLVSFRSEAATAKMTDIQELLDMAYKELGIASTGVVIDMESIFNCYGGALADPLYRNFNGEWLRQRFVPRQIEAPMNSRRAVRPLNHG